jgi:tRNA-dihydrouridine synthase B
VLVARKHIAWYSKGQTGGASFRQAVNLAATVAEQLQQVRAFLDAVEEGVALAA